MDNLLNLKNEQMTKTELYEKIKDYNIIYENDTSYVILMEKEEVTIIFEILNNTNSQSNFEVLNEILLIKDIKIKEIPQVMNLELL